MKQIAKNDQYELSVDVSKNRAYLTINGYWRNVEQVSGYISDWRRAVNYLSDGFTLLTDASTMKTHPQDVKELHKAAQELIINAGVRQVAEVLSDVIATAQLNAVSNDSKMPKKGFSSREEANAFLDSVSAEG